MWSLLLAEALAETHARSFWSPVLTSAVVMLSRCACFSPLHPSGWTTGLWKEENGVKGWKLPDARALG